MIIALLIGRKGSIGFPEKNTQNVLGKPLMYYGIPLLAGLAVAHSFIPPTPGPMIAVKMLEADVGWVILFAAALGYYAYWKKQQSQSENRVGEV